MTLCLKNRGFYLTFTNLVKCQTAWSLLSQICIHFNKLARQTAPIFIHYSNQDSHPIFLKTQEIKATCLSSFPPNRPIDSYQIHVSKFELPTFYILIIHEMRLRKGRQEEEMGRYNYPLKPTSMQHRHLWV